MILKFDSEHRFLSNFFPASVTLDGERYASVEAGYQAAKSLDPEYRRKVRECGQDSKAVKRLGKKARLRPCWNDTFKLDLMNKLVRQKFADPALKARLLATGEQGLEEANRWSDFFWGTCRGKGENHLGKILMAVRSELRAEQVEAGLRFAPPAHADLAKAA